jgi:hypothetical protein
MIIVFYIKKYYKCYIKIIHKDKKYKKIFNKFFLNINLKDNLQLIIINYK